MVTRKTNGNVARTPRPESLSACLQAGPSESKRFPEDERYSLTSQIRRSLRSVAANIAEGFRKRQYPNMFVSKLAHSDAEAAETQVWLDFARDCSYLSHERHKELTAGYEEIGKMLNSMINSPEKFAPK